MTSIKTNSCMFDNCYVLKYLVELCQASTIPEISFYFDKKKGFSVKEDDQANTKRVESMFHKNEMVYYNFDKNFFIRMNTSSLCALLRNLKKKDSIELRIDDDNKLMYLKVIAPSKGQIKNITSSIKYYDAVNPCDFLPSNNYKPSINIAAADFQNICKLYPKISPHVSVIIQEDKYICFSTEGSDMSGNSSDFGSDVLHEDQDHYAKVFDISHFQKVIKISSMCKSVKFSYHNIPDYPLRLNGSFPVGFINIFIKDKDTIKKQQDAKKKQNQ